MAQRLPSEEQIIAILRDEPMVGSQLRGALGLPKKQKMAFKQLLADMVERGLLKRTSHKEYQLGDGESLEEKREKRIKKIAEQYPEDNRRPAARSRRQNDKENETRVKRGILHQIGDEQWEVHEIDTGKVYEMCHRRQAPGKEGETISFTLYPHPKLKHSYLAKVDRSAEALNVSWDEVKTKFMEESNLPKDFSPAIKKFVEGIKEPSAKDFKGRVDYRKLDVLCIDPDGAMDHDDAISVERLPKGGFKLGVHIADVSYYVPEGSDLDKEALERSYTQYLPWTAVPMLPEKLSSGVCSLHQGVDRCAFTCMMELDKDANVLSWDFHRSIVNVSKGITYREAVQMMEAGDDSIKALAEVTALLKKNRTKEGLLEFKSTEYGCKFNEAGEPEKIVPRESDESNSWVEECMLIANNCCAKELSKRKLQGIYRIHEAPDTKDIMELYYMYPDLFKDAPVMLRDLGKPRSGDTNLNPVAFKLYQHLVKRAGDDETLMNRILRSMQKAHYDSNSFGHFALNWQDYSHFTSPIRRYADLWCHRELARKGKEINAERANSVIEVCDRPHLGKRNQEHEGGAHLHQGVQLLDSEEPHRRRLRSQRHGYRGMGHLRLHRRPDRRRPGALPRHRGRRLLRIQSGPRARLRQEERTHVPPWRQGAGEAPARRSSAWPGRLQHHREAQQRTQEAPPSGRTRRERTRRPCRCRRSARLPEPAR